MTSYSNLKSSKVFEYFKSISDVPRGSSNRKPISDYIINLASSKKLEYKVDKEYNVVVTIPSSKGYENLETVILQAHTDMVCAKDSTSTHDFDKDPIQLIFEGDILKANNTTLGADNGVAVAMILAIMDCHNDFDHPKLECLFTVDEEIGLIGATLMDPNLISGKYLINMDTEEEGEFCIGCAGGTTLSITQDLKEISIDSSYEKFSITLNNFSGGHSGIEINKELPNPIKLGARVLYEISSSTNIFISNIDGGEKHNAIPREFNVSFYAKNSEKNNIQNIIQKYKNIFEQEWRHIQKDFNFNLENKTSNSEKAYNSKDIINFLMSLPHGLTSISTLVADTVETSSNLAEVKIKDNKFLILTSLRSLLDSKKEELLIKISLMGNLLNFKLNKDSEYPAWPPKYDSKLQKLCEKTYEDVYQKKSKTVIIHAGLECGVIGSKKQNMEMISFGPDIFKVHTPKEHASVSSIDRTWVYLLKLLTNFKNI